MFFLLISQARASIINDGNQRDFVVVVVVVVVVIVVVVLAVIIIVVVVIIIWPKLIGGHLNFVQFEKWENVGWAPLELKARARKMKFADFKLLRNLNGIVLPGPDPIKENSSVIYATLNSNHSEKLNSVT